MYMVSRLYQFLPPDMSFLWILKLSQSLSSFHSPGRRTGSSQVLLFSLLVIFIALSLNLLFFKHCHPKLDTVLPQRLCGITSCALNVALLLICPKAVFALLRKESAALILCVGSEITSVPFSVKLLQFPTFYLHTLSFLHYLSLGKLLANNYLSLFFFLLIFQEMVLCQSRAKPGEGSIFPCWKQTTGSFPEELSCSLDGCEIVRAEFRELDVKPLTIAGALGTLGTRNRPLGQSPGSLFWMLIPICSLLILERGSSALNESFFHP